ncbi:MAG: LysR substrate-binding domain-containing protein [Roseimicrobium sp.]
MELRQLRYFQAVAEELSFSKAAQKLHVAQPALSRTVRELELELGAELLARTKRSVKLTPAGAVLLREAGVLLGLCEEAVRKVQRTVQGQEGELRLGYIGPPTQAFLSPLIKEFQRRHPNVSVVLEERTPERVWEMVSKNRLDVGLTRPVAAGNRIGLHTLLLRKEPLCAVVPRSHPLGAIERVAWKKLCGQPLIMLARREGVGLHDRIMAGCHGAGFSPTIAHTPSIVGTVLTYAEAGAGIGVVPESVRTLAQGDELVFKPLHPVQAVELVMVWSHAESNPAAQAFRALVMEWRTRGKTPQ